MYSNCWNLLLLSFKSSMGKTFKCWSIMRYQRFQMNQNPEYRRNWKKSVLRLPDIPWKRFPCYIVSILILLNPEFGNLRLSISKLFKVLRILKFYYNDIIKDYSKKSYYFRMFDMTKLRMIWQQEVRIS